MNTGSKTETRSTATRDLITTVPMRVHDQSCIEHVHEWHDAMSFQGFD